MVCRLFIAGLACFVIAGCGDKDRGTCLETDLYQPPPVYVMSGNVLVPIIQPVQRVCVRWEYPEGREEADGL